jgi:uncharacterized protein DUF998
VLVGSSPDHMQAQLLTISVAAARTRRLARLAIFLVLVGAALILLLHGVSKGISPLSQPISDYALTRYSWLFDLGVVVLALGLALLLCALVAAELVALGSGSFVATATCCVCLVVLVVFPDQGSAGGLSASGWAHWTAAMVAFGGLLVTPVVLGSRHRTRAGCSRLPGIARRVSYSAGAWFAMLLTGSVIELVTPLGVWRLGGLVERALSASEVVVAMLLAVWAWRGCSCVRIRSAERVELSRVG